MVLHHIVIRKLAENYVHLFWIQEFSCSKICLDTILICKWAHRAKALCVYVATLLYIEQNEVWQRPTGGLQWSQKKNRLHRVEHMSIQKF